MPRFTVVFVHGVATTASVWERVIARLDTSALRVHAVERPCSGDLAVELAALEPVVRDALVVGVSGGATLGLALAASAVPLAGAIVHEPAVGSLAPGLLAPMAAAYAEGGATGFARTLYGESWLPAMAPDPDAVGRELPMFRAFEPAAAAPGQGPILVTVGADSPPPRHEAALALHDRLGYRVEALAGCRHFVQWDNPDVLAGLIERMCGIEAARS